MFSLLPGHGLGVPDNAGIISFTLGHGLWVEIEITPPTEEKVEIKGGAGYRRVTRRIITFRIIFQGETYEKKFLLETEGDESISAKLIPLSVTGELT